MSKDNKYPFPACGTLFFDSPPADHDVCPLCEMHDKHLLNNVDKIMEKGDSRGYLISVIVITFCITGLLFFYYLMDPIFMEMWGARSGWYLDTYRTWGAKVWRMLYRSTTSLFFLLLPILWMFSAYLIQSVCKKEKAKRVNKVHSICILVLSAMAFFAYFSLMLMPLLRNVK